MPDQTVILLEDDRISRSFLRASLYLYKKYRSEIAELSSDQSKHDFIVKAWADDFSASLIFENYVPHRIEFESSNHCMLWKLKWSD